MEQDRSTQSTEALTKAFQSLGEAQEVVDELWETATSDQDSQMNHHEMVLATKARTYVANLRRHLETHARELGCPEVLTPADDGLQLVGEDAA